MYFRGGGRSSWNNRGGQATTSSYFHGTSKPSITTTSSSSPTYGGSGAAQPAVSDPCVAMWVELEEVDLNAWRCLHTAGFKLGCILYVKDATENSTNQTSGGAEAAARSFIRRAIEAHNLPAPVMVAKKEEQAAPSSSAPAAEEAQPESSNIGSLFDFGFGGGETAPKRPAPATSAPKEEEEKPVELVEDPLRGVKVCSITEFFSSGAADGIDVVYISVPSIDPCGFVEDGAGSPLKPSTATATSPKKTGTIVDRRDAFIHECVEKGKHMLMDARVVATSLATTTKWTETVLGHTRLPKVLFQDSFCLGMWPTKKMELLRRAVFGHDPSKSKTSSPSSATGKYMPAGSRYGRTTFASGGSGSPTTTPQASLLGGLRHLRLYLCSGRMSGAAAPTPRPDVLDVLGYRAIFTILAIMNWEAPVGLWARALATEETSSGTSPAGRRLVVVSGSLFFTREVTVQGSPSSPTAAKKTPRAQTRTDVVEATFFLALREVEAQSLTITGTEGHLHITDPIFPTTAPSTEAEAAHAMLPQPTPAPQPVAVDPPADTVAPETKTPVREYRPTFIHHDIPVDAPPGGRRRITHEIPLFDADASAAELSFPDDRMWRSARDLLKASTTYGGYGGSSAYSPYGRGGGYGAYRYGGTSSSPARQRFSVADTTKQMDDLQHLWLVARVLESLRDSVQR